MQDASNATPPAEGSQPAPHRHHIDSDIAAEILHYWWQRRRFIIRFMLAAVVVFAIVLFVIPNRFKAEATVIIQAPKIQTEARTEPLSVETAKTILGTGELTNQLLDRIRQSKQLVSELAKIKKDAPVTPNDIAQAQPGLVTRFFGPPTSATLSFLASLSPDDIKALDSWKPSQLDDLTVEELSEALNVEDVVEKKTATDIKMTPLLKLFAVANTGPKARLIANTWAQLFVAKYNDIVNDRQKTLFESMRQQQVESQAELKSIQDKVVRFKAANNIELFRRLADQYLDDVKTYTAQLIQKRHKLATERRKLVESANILNALEANGTWIGEIQTVPDNATSDTNFFKKNLDIASEAAAAVRAADDPKALAKLMADQRAKAAKEAASRAVGSGDLPKAAAASIVALPAPTPVPDVDSKQPKPVPAPRAIPAPNPNEPLMPGEPVVTKPLEDRIDPSLPEPTTAEALATAMESGVDLLPSRNEVARRIGRLSDSTAPLTLGPLVTRTHNLMRMDDIGSPLAMDLYQSARSKTAKNRDDLVNMMADAYRFYGYYPVELLEKEKEQMQKDYLEAVSKLRLGQVRLEVVRKSLANLEKGLAQTSRVLDLKKDISDINIAEAIGSGNQEAVRKLGTLQFQHQEMNPVWTELQSSRLKLEQELQLVQNEVTMLTAVLPAKERTLRELQGFTQMIRLKEGVLKDYLERLKTANREYHDTYMQMRYETTQEVVNIALLAEEVTQLEEVCSQTKTLAQSYQDLFNSASAEQEVLQSEQKAIMTNADSLLTKFQDAQTAMRQQTSDVTLAASAVTPQKHFFPKRSLSLLLLTFLSGVALLGALARARYMELARPN